MYGHVPVQHTK